MMSWLWSKTDSSNSQKHLSPREKLKAYYDLAREALERAYEADRAGFRDKAVKLYHTGLTIIQEGLAYPVQGTGLGPKADTIESWKHDLRSWQQQAMDRIRNLESGHVSASTPIAPLTNTSVGETFTANGVRRPQSGRSASTSHGGATTERGRSGGGSAPRVGTAATAAAPAATSTAPGTSSRDDQKYRDAVYGEILETAAAVCWDDIAGLGTAKQALTEAVVLPSLRPDLFQGLRAPVRGILLYGPPGNGKTMLGKALAHEAKSTFFNISASSLTSKWVGDGEKLVRALFQVAAEQQPSIIFIDEIDSILSSRTASENDAMRRLKTEFLVQFDGVAGGSDRVIVVGATNRPAELDDAVRRRLVKRIYIPLPDEAGRRAVLQHLLRHQAVKIQPQDLEAIVRATAGYSGSDLTALCKEAAMAPIRELGPRVASVPLSQIRPIRVQDFAEALKAIKPSVNRAMLAGFEEFTREYGMS